MIDDINKREKGHILTIEDPIEFVHQRKQLPDQPARDRRCMRRASPQALHSALREDPDVILVGEMRDLETIQIAVTAAEMGILVMGTLHTNGAAPTVDRIVNVFPADKQSHVRTMLSTSLRGVVSQQLLQRADKQGRVAALEILVNNSAVSQPDPPGQARPAREHHAVRRQPPACAPWTPPSRHCSTSAMITGKEAYKKAINKARFEAFKDARLELGPVAAADPGHPRAALRQRSAAPRPHDSSPCRPTSGCASSGCAGHDCIFVCAEDCHGTPIMIKARQDGITPEQLIATRGGRAPARLRRLRHRLRQLPLHALGGEPALLQRAVHPAGDGAAPSPAARSARPTTNRPACSCRTASCAAPARAAARPTSTGIPARTAAPPIRPADLKDAVSTITGTQAGAARIRAPVLQARRLRSRT